jgi:hypothetical protein
MGGDKEGARMILDMFNTLAARLVADESGEVNTAAILAWTVVAVLAIMAINVAFGNLVGDAICWVRTTIGIGGSC